MLNGDFECGIRGHWQVIAPAPIAHLLGIQSLRISADGVSKRFPVSEYFCRNDGLYEEVCEWASTLAHEAWRE